MYNVWQNFLAPHRVYPDKPFFEFERSEIDQSITSRFEKQVAKYPSRLAVKEGRFRLTYAGLNQAANQIAHDIVERSGEENIPVALFLEQGIRLIAAILGALKAGKAYIALDTSFSAQKNVSLVENSRPRLILTDKGHYPEACKLFKNTSPLMIVDEASSIYSPSNLDLPISPESMAYIIYTSGSTGEPKGVLQNHQNVLHNVMRCTNMLHIAPDDRLGLLWSCSFAASIPNIFGALLNGAALFPYNIKKNGIINLADWLTDEEITIYHSVPTVYRHLLSTLTGKEDFSSLRLIKLSGESIRKTDVELYNRHFHKKCLFHVSYASTETNIVRQLFFDHNSKLNGDVVPAGYEVDDMEVLVLDENGKEAGANCPGEIAVLSTYLPPAYFKNENSAKPAFPVYDGKRRIYKTGDIGYMLPDGCLVHLGRKDQQIKIRGYRVEISEIETALSELAPVKEAAVVGYDDPSDGNFLAAYVVAREESEVSAGELRNALRSRLPDYMVPARFVFLDALPFTLSGKVNRRALPFPGPEGPEPGTDYVPPRTPMEVLLAGIWCDLLGVKRVGVSDNFFDLGGHSLLVAQMAVKIKKATGKTLQAASIFRSPTIKQITEILHRGESISRFPSILPLSGGSGIPLFWLGFSAFLQRYLDAGQPVYWVMLQGDNGTSIRYRDVKKLAAYHLRVMMSVQPGGPYLLGGFCFYGLVAFEMAQRLIERGEEVPLLCLVDPPPQLLPLSGPSSASFSSEVFLKSPFDFLYKRLKENIKTSICTASLLTGLSVPRRLRYYHHVKISRKYAPCAYKGRTVVFLNGKDGDAHDLSGFADSRTYVHKVPGAEHDTILKEPHAGTWIRQLSGYLKQIQASGHCNEEAEISAGAKFIN